MKAGTFLAVKKTIHSKEINITQINMAPGNKMAPVKNYGVTSGAHRFDL